MNRFRTKKRAKDDLAASRTSEDSDHSGLSFFRKGKKTQQEEPKKEFDLSTALPSTDDFRTSLLMANLSARFSMLREQDDPNTKIGKASDDSVLFPKRQSRMAEFGFGLSSSGLSDIAEVESIRGNTIRTKSVSSDDPDASTTPGSIMSRGRPTEGNNLFGGRQRIYKVPANASGLTGRAVYEDDVSMSAFQRWRISEREKALEELTGGSEKAEDDNKGENKEEAKDETTQISNGSPFIGHNRKRETSSTTSSSSMAARNSTAATLVTSQPASSAKDNQSSSSSGVTIPERNVMRTRRLYEQFSQESTDSQPSALSSLARPRPFGAKVTEASSTTDTATRKVGTTLGSSKVQTDPKPTLGGQPPLSPPVSEGEQVVLPILPKDVGKATALAIFDKPLTSYDESQYVQRQLQLHQGRDTPTQRDTPESKDEKSQEAQPKTLPLQDSRLPPTPATEAATPSSASDSLAALGLSLEVNIERPADEDHPAFRKSALPTPLSIETKPDGGKSDYLTVGSQNSPIDSPTLPQTTSGLSGLIRQHLRMESFDSSIGDIAPERSAAASRPTEDSNPRPSLGDNGSALSPWPSSDQDWIRSNSTSGPATTTTSTTSTSTNPDFLPKVETSEFKVFDRSSTATEEETDEFASQLTNARRRIREKLTSYVESDSSRAPSPSLAPADSPSAAPASNNALGILKPKSSRGSLIDRSRNLVTGPSKGLKVLGLASSTISSSPQPTKQAFDDKDFQSLETMKEEVAKEEAAAKETTSRPASDATDDSKRSSEDNGKPIHPGLKAFRQARRELQKRKELETLARHQGTQPSQPPTAQEEVRDPRNMHSASRADRPRQRTPSSERRPPPVSYRGPVPSEDTYSSPGSTRPSGERSRSGSEASNGRGHSRPPRLRTGTIDEADQLDAPYVPRPMMRSPGLPGKDIKGSPLTPSYPYPYANRGAPSPAPSPHLDRQRSNNNLALQTGRPNLDVFSGQPSPVSPMGLPSPAPYANAGGAPSPAGTPTTLGSRPRLPSDAKHSPAYMSNRGPAPAPPSPGQRPLDDSNAPPPPVPPINPRRRRYTAAAGTDAENAGPRRPFVGPPANGGTSFDYPSDDDSGSNTRPVGKLRKAHPDLQQSMMGGRTTRDNSPSYAARAPPASRVNGIVPGSTGVPEGMI